MLQWLAEILQAAGGPSAFQYVTFRAAAAFVTAFILGLVYGRRVIHFLFRKGIASPERDYGSIDASSKRGTPTMGGLVLLGASLLSVALWCDLTNPFVHWLVAAALYFAAVGGVDDILKVRGGHSDKGLSSGAKYVLQTLFAVAFAVCIVHPATSPLHPDIATKIYIPFVKSPLLDLGWGYGVFIVFVIVAFANAANFADGLDGMLSVPAMLLLAVIAVFAYVHAHALFARYLFYPHIPGAWEVTGVAAALSGGCLAYLRFNANPAEVFMGDLGSMSLGAIVGVAAVLLKEEFICALAGGVFVAQVGSSFVQRYYGLRAAGARVITRAPLHHVFEHRGTAENKIVVRYWIVSALLAVTALATLKLR